MWSPDGIHLYFQLAFSAHVLNGETKALFAMPEDAGLPQGEALWLSNNSFAVTLKNAEGALHISQFELPEQPGSPLVLSKETPIELREPLSMQATEAPHLVYLTALNSEDKRTVYQLDIHTGKAKEAFEWMEVGVESFSYHSSKDSSLAATIKSREKSRNRRACLLLSKRKESNNAPARNDCLGGNRRSHFYLYASLQGELTKP